MKKKAKDAKTGRASNLSKPRRESTITMLMRLLLTPVASAEQRNKSGVPPLKAIVTQLVRKALEGDAPAIRVLERYRHFALRGIAPVLRVEFVEGNSTGDSQCGAGEEKNV